MIQSQMQHHETESESRPLVTVLLATRNEEAHIRECLSGLLEQSIAQRMEVIVVDQGSEQAEWAVVADLQRQHKNLISLRLSPAAGRDSGLDLAARMASGKYLTVVSATDRMRPDAYQILTGALERDPGAVLAYGDTCFTAVPHQSFAECAGAGQTVWPDYGREKVAAGAEVAPHPVWRRELVESIGAIGNGPKALGSFLLKAAERFRVLHVSEFTALRFTPATAAPKPQAAPRVAAGPAAPAPLGADEAFARIAALAKGGELQQAAGALQQHLQSYPDHAIAHNNLAAIYYQLGEKESALRHYRFSVQLAPQEVTYQKNLADFLYVEGADVDQAIGIYLELHQRYPNDVEVLLNLGIICEGVGQPAEAGQFYQRALEIEPWNQAVRERLSELHKSPERTAERTVPSPEELYQRAQARVAQGDQDGAARELEQLLASYPDFAAAHNDLAVLSYQRGSKEQALAHYEKAAALDPENSTYQKNLADFYFVEGHDVDGAIAIYLDQLRKQPGDVETLMNLGRICEVLDRPQEAETFYGKVAQLEPWNTSARECLSNLRQCANG